MLSNKQMNRTVGKINHFQRVIEKKMFVTRDNVPMEILTTFDKLFAPPAEGYKPAEKGTHWGVERQYAWLRGTYTVPDSLAGKQIFLRPMIGFKEGMLFINATPAGIFTQNTHAGGAHGKHYCLLLTNNAKAGETFRLAIELYAGHNIVGTQPFDDERQFSWHHEINEFLICEKDPLICNAYFNFRMLNELTAVTKDEFRKAELTNCMADVHKILYYFEEETETELFRTRLAEAVTLIENVLAIPNGPNAPELGIIGHSHMDTAWLWELDETIRKCARTYSNALSLMEQYPEYKFLQSSAYHGEWMRRYYPALFENIKKAVAEGKYEPNGGVWVECDCNITSGEFMIRQFLWGQRFTREHFNYTSDVFWLPDTFGYSAAIPQIMKGCAVDYFMTTKIDWNDSNSFPFDSFYWKGLDGTCVFSHFNRTHVWPAPPDITNIANDIKQKNVTNKRYLAFGFGDGGGGPEFEMVEMARRSADVKGMPKATYKFAGDFMKELEETAVNPNVYRGELYLELHRGTLTSIAQIKRNNRKAEQAIRDAELITVINAINAGVAAKSDEIRLFVETTLVNQFHDILPGTSIPQVNDRSFKEMGEVLAGLHTYNQNNLPSDGDTNFVTAFNSLATERNNIRLPYKEGHTIEGETTEVIENIDGEKFFRVFTPIPSLAAKVFKYVSGTCTTPSAFTYDEKTLETPFAKITFDENGYIASFIDKRNHREIKGEGYNLNTFLLSEDVPLSWDNWDVDADNEVKLASTAKLISRKVITNGGLEFRLRSEYQLTKNSTLIQDMVCYTNAPRVDFETKIHWNDKHRLLKTAFDTNIFTAFARQEIQFGYATRPTTRNNSIEEAKFETLNHKFTDLSEPNYGVALLNDCKYGISVHDSAMRLSLIKSGTKPDPRGDKGIHYMTYALLPHTGGFNAETVTHAGYDLNNDLLIKSGAAHVKPFAAVSNPGVILETVKPCEDAEKAFIVRLYECEGNHASADLTFGFEVKDVHVTNMLEEVQETLGTKGLMGLPFRPFEIKTLKINY